jgi:hypothetical protein
MTVLMEDGVGEIKVTLDCLTLKNKKVSTMDLMKFAKPSRPLDIVT